MIEETDTQYTEDDTSRRDNIVFYILATLLVIVVVGAIGGFVYWKSDGFTNLIPKVGSDPFLDCIEQSNWTVIDRHEVVDESGIHTVIFLSVAHISESGNMWYALRTCTEEHGKAYTDLTLVWVYLEEFTDVYGETVYIGSIYVVWVLDRELILNIPEEETVVYLSEKSEEIQTVFCNQYECLYFQSDPYHLQQALDEL